MLIPRLYDSIISGDKVKLAGQSGIQINPIHVSDASHALLSTLNSKDLQSTFNLAGKQVISLRQICDLFGNFLNILPRYRFLEENFNQDIVGDITRLSPY